MHQGSGSNGGKKGWLTDVLSIINILSIFFCRWYKTPDMGGEFAHVPVATDQSSTASIHLHNKHQRVPHQLLKQRGAQWKWLADMWKPNTAHFLSDHHRPRFHSAALLNCKKNNSSCHGCYLFVASLWEFLGMERWAPGSDVLFFKLIRNTVELIWKWSGIPLGLLVSLGVPVFLKRSVWFATWV